MTTTHGVTATPVLVINGPTAGGKTTLSVAVAQRLAFDRRPAEVVNADSMLVYRGMDIGTAKPTLAERGGVTHHLIDILDVTDIATVADLQARARATITDLQGRGVVPVVVGGSALYVHAIIDDFQFPGTDPEVRARWEAELERVGASALHAVLAERAPDVAAGIQPRNGRRVVRALEILDLDATPTSMLPQWQYALDGVVQVGLDWDRAELDERIAQRVEVMWESGFVDEVRALVGQGLRDGLTASRALGYRQVLAALAGECTLDEAKADTVAKTRRFARKQLSWFRRDPRIVWLPATASDLVERTLALLGC